jgi:hypothetical protein
LFFPSSNNASGSNEIGDRHLSIANRAERLKNKLQLTERSTEMSQYHVAIHAWSDEKLAQQAVRMSPNTAPLLISMPDNIFCITFADDTNYLDTK